MKRLVLTAAAIAAIALPGIASAQDGVGQIRRGVPNPDRSVTNTEREQQFERQQEDRRAQERERERQARERQARNNQDRWDNRDDRWDRNDRWGDDRFGSNRGWSRTDRDWWRGRSEFRGYSGLRSGYWFYPSYGYIRPEPRLFNYRWRVGEYVPVAYRRYEVVDPRMYGLDWPPPGHRWVYLGDYIVLMAPDGRIVERVRDIF